MTAKKVALYWHCKTPKGWKRYRAATGRNGKVRPGYAQVRKAQIVFLDGHYELDHPGFLGDHFAMAEWNHVSGA